MSVPPHVDVLVVEDDRLVSELLVHALHAAQLTTDVAGDLLEAKRLLARGDYRILVLDLLLPGGTGFDLMDFIKSGKLLHPQIIVVTAADASLLTRLDRSLVKSVMFKPLDVQHFLAAVRSLLAAQPAHT
jgi:DNA-binding response OmpR family regulator